MTVGNIKLPWRRALLAGHCILETTGEQYSNGQKGETLEYCYSHQTDGILSVASIGEFYVFWISMVSFMLQCWDEATVPSGNHQ
jgi:hypothetical protein